ncbi:MAG: phosphatase PAP2 family protein, partial [bacterium]|nr:phosphatase PAP2 family protein [bacterium]
HAANSFTMAANIAAIYGPWYGIPAYSVATLISLSRLDTNKHFLSDVLFGATVGTAFALGVNRFHKNKKRTSFLMPQMDQNSIGMEVMYAF